MKWRIITVVKVLCIVSVYAVPVVEAQPRLTLFPESIAEIEDGFAGDKDPQVDVIVVTNIPVPESGGQLLFSGEVRWGQTANTGGKIENATLVITNATITNTSTATFQLAAEKIINVASKSHPTWAGKGVVGQVGFEGELTPPGAFTSPTQRLTLSLYDSGVDFLPPTAHIKLDAKWMAGTGFDPWKMSVSASAKGTTTTGPSSMMLWVDEIVIGANQTMHFPNSITAEFSSKAIPAVSPWILAALVLLLAATGGVFITRRHRALAH